MGAFFYLKDYELNDGERLMMESNLTALLKEQVEKLRKQIEDEMERNKVARLNRV